MYVCVYVERERERESASFRIPAENKWHDQNWAIGGRLIYKRTVVKSVEPQGKC